MALIFFGVKSGNLTRKNPVVIALARA